MKFHGVQIIYNFTEWIIFRGDHKFVDWPTHEIHEIEYPTEINDLTVVGQLAVVIQHYQC